MKRLLVLLILLWSCTTPSRVTYQEALGKTKQQIIMERGAPDRIESDGAGGEILVYEWSNQQNVGGRNGRTGSFRELRRYNQYYVDADGIVYFVRWKNSTSDEGEVKKEG